jgi:hypothetical protein
VDPLRSFGGSTEEHGVSAHRAAEPKDNRTKAAVAGLLVIALAAAGFLGYRYFLNSRRINSIAVLPLQNSSGNVDSDISLMDSPNLLSIDCRNYLISK